MLGTATESAFCLFQMPKFWPFVNNYEENVENEKF